MLLWQQRNMPKAVFCAQLITLVFLFHVISMLLLILQSGTDSIALHVLADKNYDLQAHVVLLPFTKVVPQTVPIKEQIVQSTAVLIDESKKKDVSIVKKIDNAPTEKALSVQKQNEPNKQEKEQTIHSVDTQKSNQVTEKAHNERIVTTKEESMYIGRKQLEVLNIQRVLSQEIQKYWHPPEGFSKDTLTMLIVQVAMDGSIRSIETKRGSGILAYDIHARNAVYAMHFPKACWGKEVTMIFKQ